MIDIVVEEMPTGEISAGAGIGTNGSVISFLLKALEILLWDGIIIKNVVNHITKSRIRLLIIKKSLEK